MAIVTFILGHSGSGKSHSLKNLDKSNTALIKIENKPLPFRGGHEFQGITNDKADYIKELLPKIKSDVIVIDDFQYLMANAFMRRSHEKGFDKFTDIGRDTWDILKIASNLSPEKRVYILSHTQENESGKTSIKTIGKLLDDKITLEGMVTIVLKTVVSDGNYQFATKNSGSDTVKSPADMFEADLIPNDLNAVDKTICDYYGITRQDADQAAKPTQEKQANKEETIQANEQTLQAQAAEQSAFEEAEGF